MLVNITPRRFVNFVSDKLQFMSHAFVREGDHQDLQDIAPTITALVAFLTNENGGIRVYEKKLVKGTNGEIVHMMSNGLGYRVNAKSQWEIA